MIDYNFLKRRFDQLNSNNYLDAEYMVDSLLFNNCQGFMRFNLPNNEIADICLELWRYLDSTNNIAK